MSAVKDILFDKFELDECLKKDNGIGVYSAFHVFLGKKILLKTLDRSLISDDSILHRFQREAKTLARLDHPNIIKVLDFGTYESFFYISFEFFESQNLRQVLQAGGLTAEKRLDILRQLLRGLEFAHSYGIIHRDLKPENILVDHDGMVKIADFGLALVSGEEKVTQAASIVGTPGYMSPEQIRGEVLTAQTDLFSLGVVAYEMFVGENPFLGRDVGSTLNNILTQKIAFDQLTAPVDALLPRLLAKNRRERIDSAHEAAQLLQDEKAPVVAAEKVVARRLKPMWIPGALLLILLLLWIFSHQKIAQTNDAAFPPIAAHADSQMTTTADPESASDKKTDDQRPAISANAAENSNFINFPPPIDARGTVFIECSPWAMVYIDDQQVDTTPLEDAVSVTAGVHSLRLEHPTYPPYVQKFRIQAAEKLHISVNLDTLFGFLDCRIYPWGEVYVDQDSLGATPFAQPLRLMPGRHVLMVKNNQFGSIRDTITIRQQDTLTFQLNFERLLAGETN